MTFIVKYCKGLGSDRKVEAETIEEAKKLGLAEYRKNTGSDETVSMLTMDQVVAEVVAEI